MLTTITTTAANTQWRQQYIQQSQQKKKQRVKQQNRQLLLFGITFFIGLILFVPIGTNALPLTSYGEHSVETKYYCSISLSDAIRQVCHGQYNSLGRNYPDSVGRRRSRSLQSLAPDSDDTYYRPLVYGPIHECCRHPCGYAELIKYCAPIEKQEE